MAWKAAGTQTVSLGKGPGIVAGGVSGCNTTAPVDGARAGAGVGGGASIAAGAWATWIGVGVERGNWSAEQTGEEAAAAAGVEVAAGLAGQIVKLGVGAGSSIAAAPQAKGADAGVGLDARVAMQIGRLGVVAGTLVAWEV